MCIHADKHMSTAIKLTENNDHIRTMQVSMRVYITVKCTYEERKACCISMRSSPLWFIVNIRDIGMPSSRYAQTSWQTHFRHCYNRLLHTVNLDIVTLENRSSNGKPCHMLRRIWEKKVLHGELHRSGSQLCMMEKLCVFSACGRTKVYSKGEAINFCQCMSQS